MVLLGALPPSLSSLPWGFFWLAGDHALRLVALKAGIFAQGCALGKSDFGLICHFLVVGLALPMGLR
jgi:hypothetical protein